jgi:hypothetical protein
MPKLVEWPDSSLIKPVDSQHLPYIKTYRVTVDFPTQAAALDFINSLSTSKSSGVDGDAGDWTKAGDGKSYPVTNLPTQAQADAAAGKPAPVVPAPFVSAAPIVPKAVV